MYDLSNFKDVCYLFSFQTNKQCNKNCMRPLSRYTGISQSLMTVFAIQYRYQVALSTDSMLTRS